MRRSSVSVVAVVAAGAGLVACREAPPPAKPLTPVRVQAASAYAESTGIRYSGAVEPVLRVDVAFKRGGYVESLLQVGGAGASRTVQAGDRVTTGAVLAKVRETDYSDKRDQAMSGLRQAEASLAYATQEFERAERLLAANSVTKVDRDGAKTKLDVARAQLDGARSLVQEADNALAETAVRAPIDGVVLARMVEVGSLAGPGTPAFVLADTSRVKVVFGAPDVVVNDLRVGTPQTVTTAALPSGQIQGTISRIAPNADPRSRVFDVEVTIANPADHLKPGMVVALQVAHGAPLAAPVVVPLSAIIRAPGQSEGYAVMVVESDGDRQVARLRPVGLGQAFGNSIAVTQGLKVGERVIVAGGTLVADGEAVSVPRS